MSFHNLIEEARMLSRKNILKAALIFFFPCLLLSQQTPWFQWTFLPPAQMDEIIGESSGETAFNHTLAMAGYNRDRRPEEYKTTFLEAQYVLDQLKDYEFTDAEIVRYKGGKTWDGIKGELWEISPGRRKLASYTDMRAMLASGSNSTDVEADLVWVEEGTAADLKDLDVTDKIVVTSGSANGAHRTACLQMGAAGVISFDSPRPLIDPLAVPWGGVRGSSSNPAKFAFYLPPREGHILRDRLRRGEKIRVHAEVESKMEGYDLQDVVCSIPGTDKNAQEIIFSAHLFEGYTKQGANDNISGCAAILEMARTLKVLIDGGRLPKPRRTIRFLWAPEFSGTIPWVNAHKDIMARTLCNINLDMVGLELLRTSAFMTLMRTTFGNAHYINDVMENYYRFVGESNRTYVTNGFGRSFPYRMVSPSGSEDPFIYYMGTHQGASDHEVFNDWGVGVPGVIMNTWPDRWYHTSEDRTDKMDPTQMKRVVIIGAAAAYTIASADEDMAFRIGTEIVSNAAGRISHQLARGLEEMQRAGKEELAEAYKRGRGYVEAASLGERETLRSLAELAADQPPFLDNLQPLLKAVGGVEESSLAVLEAGMDRLAEDSNRDPVKQGLSDQELAASKIFPKATEKTKANGYGGYRQAVSQAQKALNQSLANRRFSRTAPEIQLLCNGRLSALDILKMVNTQFRQETSLDQVLSHLELLEAAGLVVIERR
jgi:aminopeptidase YwaD